MPSRRPRTKEEFIAAKIKEAESQWEERKPLGRRDVGADTMTIIHFVAQKLKGKLSQTALRKATDAFYKTQVQTHGPGWSPLSHNTLQKYVKAYLLYRSGRLNSSNLPPRVRRAIDDLPPLIHADTLLGLVASVQPNLVKGPRSTQLRQQTSRILKISSLK